MQITIHSAALAALSEGAQPTDYLKKITKASDEPEVEAEMQQGAFNDVNEIGTSKKRKKRKAK